MPPLNKLQKTGLVLAISQGLSLSANAATITVNNSGDSGEGCTFREAVARVNSGGSILNGCQSTASAFGTLDRILFDVDAVDGLTSAVEIKKSVIINLDGDTVTISSAGNDRVLRISSSDAVIMDQLVITGGSTDFSGGGLFVSDGASLILRNSHVTNNQARFEGGGISVYRNAEITINNSTISGNTAGGVGGGIAAQSNSRSTINATSISNNTSFNDGGGVSAQGNSQLTINNSTISANAAGSSQSNSAGGGFIIVGSSANLTNTTISGNRVVAYGAFGGAGSVRDSSQAVFNNVTISDNEVNGRSLSENAGLLIVGSDVTFNNTIVANSKNQGLAAFSECSASNAIPSTIITDANTIIEGGGCNAVRTEDPGLLPLADNGGPTQTHALMPTSIAIDSGGAATCPATDQRGEQRDVNCDVGAFEFIDNTGFFVIPLKNGKTVVIPE